MTFLRPAAVAATTLIADAELVDCNGTNALAQVRVCDDLGTLVAHGTSRYFLFAVAPPDDADPAPPRLPEYGSPDPYLRRARGAVVGRMPRGAAAWRSWRHRWQVSSPFRRSTTSPVSAPSRRALASVLAVLAAGELIGELSRLAASRDPPR